MSGFRAKSPPELVLATSITSQQQYDDSALEGVAAHVKLLLKLIQDHKDNCDKEKNDRRRMLRVATMMTILDNVRERIQKCQSFGNKKSEAELRRCNTELKPTNLPSPRRQGGGDTVVDECERLRRQLNSSLAARKSLEIMCSSYSKEKEIMAAELSRKVHELSGIEELLNDLKVQNENLLEKVRECGLKHKEKSLVGGFGGLGRGEMQGNAALLERNKALSEQLLKSLDGYRSMKRKLKESNEENVMIRGTMDEIGAKVVKSLEKVRSFKERASLSEGSDPSPTVDVQDEIIALENMFECFQMLVAKYDQKQGECLKVKGEIKTCNPSVVA